MRAKATTCIAMSLLGLARAHASEVVEIQTELGAITVRVDTEHAPLTAANFLRYVADRAYDGASFYRTVTGANQPNDHVRIEVIQAGLAESGHTAGRAAVPLERTSKTSLIHRAGTVSMARGAEADSATSEFFICVTDQPELDFGGKRHPDGQGFAPFGTVIEGMDVVRAIHLASATGQRLDPPIRIIAVKRARSSTPRR